MLHQPTPEPAVIPLRDHPDDARPRAALRELQQRHRACRLCVEAGHLPAARPVFSGHHRQRIALVGQAPGPMEAEQGQPFSGRAGRQLMRWLQRAGFADEQQARERIYFISATTCFPGRRPGGAGDRRPTPAEVALCTPWREQALDIVRPRLLLPVGSLALSLYLPGRCLDDVVGRVLLPDGRAADADRDGVPPLLLPLPHPSGQSRWLNQRHRAALLDQALERLRGLAPWAEGGPGRRVL